MPSLISSIGSAAKRFSGRPLEISSKFLGAASIAAVLYDAHKNGKETALVRDTLDTADRYEGSLSDFGSMNKKSPSIAKAKGVWFRMHASNSWRHMFSRLSGYLEGAAKTLAGDIPQIVFSVIALKTKNHPLAGKLSGVLLALNAAKTFIFDIAGIGRGNKV